MEGVSCELRRLVLVPRYDPIIVVHYVGEGDPPAAIDRHRVAYVGTEVSWVHAIHGNGTPPARDGVVGLNPYGCPSEGVELHDGEALHVRVVGLVPHPKVLGWVGQMADSHLEVAVLDDRDDKAAVWGDLHPLNEGMIAGPGDLSHAFD